MIDSLMFFLTPHTHLLKYNSVTGKGLWFAPCFYYWSYKLSFIRPKLRHHLKSIEIFLLFCSSVTVPVARQPNIQPGLSDQTHISLNIFDTILKTTITRVELECSWAVIERDINIQEQLEARQQPRNQP
jgi:hypothetical protein